MSSRSLPAFGRPTIDQLTAAAHRAAAAWDLDVARVELVSLTENAVFRIDTVDGDRHVLRLHRPGYNTRSEMDSELQWLEALRESGLDVPAPRRKPAGHGYLEVPVEVVVELPVGAEGKAGVGTGREIRLAGLIEWVDGENLEDLLDRADADTRSLVSAHYPGIGRALAAIRLHGERWDPPPGFSRRRWDADGLVGPDPLWGRFWEIPDERADRSLFQQARVALHRRLSDLPTDRSAFGLIHADLHSRNVMVDDDRMIIIDFDDSGFGWYLHDLAVALHPATDETWFDQAKQALIAGYRSVHPLSDHELSLLPAFLTIRSLMIVSWLEARPELGLQHLLPKLIAGAAEDAERYLAG